MLDRRTKLTLHYEDGEIPMLDLLRLGGGQGTDVLVEELAENSKAERAGVQAGFALTTINGYNQFIRLPGWQVRLLLEAPITLGFDPEPVKPTSAKCTEIRLARAEHVLGIPPRVAVCGPLDAGLLAEEVVFKPGSAPLWLISGGGHGDPVPALEPSQAAAGGRRPRPQAAAAQVPRRIYELRRPEASAIVGHAMRTASAATRAAGAADDGQRADRAAGGTAASSSAAGDAAGGVASTVQSEKSEPELEAAWAAAMGCRSAPQAGPSAGARSSTSPCRALCSLDCVAECIDDEMLVTPEMRNRGKTAPQQRAAPAAGLLASTAPFATPSSPFAARAGSAGRPSAENRLRLGVQSREQPQPPPPARESRSPLRWIEPVLGPLASLARFASPQRGAGQAILRTGRAAASFGPRSPSPTQLPRRPVPDALGPALSQDDEDLDIDAEGDVDRLETVLTTRRATAHFGPHSPSPAQLPRQLRQLGFNRSQGGEDLEVEGEEEAERGLTLDDEGPAAKSMAPAEEATNSFDQGVEVCSLRTLPGNASGPALASCQADDWEPPETLDREPPKPPGDGDPCRDAPTWPAWRRGEGGGETRGGSEGGGGGEADRYANSIGMVQV